MLNDPKVFPFASKSKSTLNYPLQVRDDPKLLGDSGEVPISERSGWLFDSRCEIFLVLDGKKFS